MQRPNATGLRLVGFAPDGAPTDAPVGTPPTPSVLRLVTPEPERGVRSRRAARHRRGVQRAVVAENRAAAGLSPDDARAILAARVAESIEGGRAAILRPLARRNLNAVGAALGLRPFDTSLVIAILQDQARQGGAHAADDRRLAMLPRGTPRQFARASNRRTALYAVIGVAVLAIGLFAALVRWVTRS